jgi:hypothetical protein
LSAKHSTVFPLRRYGFIGGAATLLVVLVAWVAVRAVGPTSPDTRTPLMVQPTIPVAEDVIPSPVASPTPSPSASPSPSRTRKPASTPKPTEKATTTKPPAKASPTPATSFTARYRLGSTWDRGFVAAVEVKNTGTTARTWTVSITYGAQAGVRVGNTWNAQLDRQGDRFVFTGAPLAAGTSITFGFEASKQLRSQIQPTTCTINGAPCRLG